MTEHTRAACPALSEQISIFSKLGRAFSRTPFSNLLPLQEKAFSSPFPLNLPLIPSKKATVNNIQIVTVSELGPNKSMGEYTPHIPLPTRKTLLSFLYPGALFAPDS